MKGFDSNFTQSNQVGHDRVCLATREDHKGPRCKDISGQHCAELQHVISAHVHGSFLSPCPQIHRWCNWEYLVAIESVETCSIRNLLRASALCSHARDRCSSTGQSRIPLNGRRDECSYWSIYSGKLDGIRDVWTWYEHHSGRILDRALHLMFHFLWPLFELTRAGVFSGDA